MEKSTIYVVSNDPKIYDELIEAGKSFSEITFLGGGPINEESLKEISIGKPDYLICQQMEAPQLEIMLNNSPDTKIVMLTDFYEAGLETIAILERNNFTGHLVLDLTKIDAREPLNLIVQDIKYKEQENVLSKAFSDIKVETLDTTQETDQEQPGAVSEVDDVGDYETVQRYVEEDQEAIKRAQSLSIFNSLSSKTVVVHSRRGGVGKTTVAKELANTYASLKLNKKAKTVNRTLNVCLVDLDFSQGSLRTQLGVENQFPNIYQWIEDIVMRLKNGTPFDLIKYDKLQVMSRWVERVGEEKSIYLVHTAQGDLPVSILREIDQLEQNNIVKVEDLYTAIIQKIITSLQNAFDMVVIDTETTMTETTYAALQMADNIVIPMFPTVGDVENLKVLTNELKSFKKEVDFNKFSIIVNKASKRNGLDDFSEVLNLIKFESFNYETGRTGSKTFPIIATMPYDANVVNAENLFLYYTDTGSSEYKKGILTLAEHILPIFKIKSINRNRATVNLNKEIKRIKKKDRKVRTKKDPLIVADEIDAIKSEGEIGEDEPKEKVTLTKKEQRRQKARQKLKDNIRKKEERRRKKEERRQRRKGVKGKKKKDDKKEVASKVKKEDQKLE